MRTAFINQLINEAKNNEKIFLIVGDLGFHVVEPFAEAYPNRFLNAGIAEQDMIGIAVGLAKEGYNVYVYSIANFPTLRCMEQIRYDVAYHQANVKIVSVGAGFAYGSLGASHHATEDIGMIRTIPNMVVCSPGDPIEAKAITHFSANNDGPMYIRLGKAGEEKVHKDELYELRLGEILTIKEEKEDQEAIIATGSILKYALDEVNSKNFKTDIYSLPFIKPINRDMLKFLSLRYAHLTVMEEHQKSCGAGSAIVEQFSDMYEKGEIQKYPKIRRIAINDEFFSISGNQDFLRAIAGIKTQ